MDRDRGFNFKLLVPPRVNTGQISAVRPQEIIEDRGDFVNTLQQDYSKCFDKEKNMTSPSTSLVVPIKSTRQDFPKMNAVSSMEKDVYDCNPGQLYSKLFDEVEKVKWWKVKVDSDTVQKERQLQENKRTIETQRKAIQELQFGIEGLSIKLEEQISENEDLKNKTSATRNLCNILKDTFERSAEKMHLFESEREETHHLFMENSENIQKLIAAFESLRIQAEVDQQEMQKVKEDLVCLAELKKKYQQQCKMWEEEVAGLQTSIKQKENELQEVVLELHKTQKHCKELQETTNQQYELLKTSKTERESLFQNLQSAELHCKEHEKSLEAITAALEKNEEEYKEIIQSRDVRLQELNKVKLQQAEKLEQIKKTIEELQNSLSLKIQRIKELDDKLTANSKEAERTKTLLEEMMKQGAMKDEQIVILEDKLDKKSKSFEAMKCELDMTNIRVEELTVELSRKIEEDKEFKIKMQELEAKLLAEMKIKTENTSQIEQLKNSTTHYKVKYEELLSSFNQLQSEKAAIQQQFESRSSFVKVTETNMKVNEEKVVKLTREFQMLEEENQSLKDKLNANNSKIQEKCQETETLQKNFENNCECLQKEITGKEKRIKVMETKLCSLRQKIEAMLKVKEEHQKENKMLKNQMAKEIAKSTQLESVISGLYEESQNMKRLNEEDHQKLLGDLEGKSAFAAELENEVKQLKLTTADAIKNKEDTELKCQHKISDMVTLMEKHKSQYDRMVEEKDAELQESRKKEVETVAHKQSLELDLSKHKTENDNLKKQLKKETIEKENLQKELTDLKKELTSLKITPLSEAKNKQSHASNHKQGRCSEISKESSVKRHVFDFSKMRKTPSYSKEDGGTAVLKKAMAIYSKELETPRSILNQICGPSKIKSYRIKTPPSAEKASWGKSAIELDPGCDSSDQNDLFTFANAPTSNISAAHCDTNIFKRIQSPATYKSPGNSLKLAAVKRMRDAGWTAVTGCDKKKKTTNEKIFA